MRVAYLIQAHHQPSHLSRLIKALGADSVHSFVHLDLKADISQFPGIVAPNVTVLKDRIRVYRGGFSQVRVNLNLLKAAMNHGDFDYFILLSGVDYPIKPPRLLFDFLGRNSGMNYINFFPLTDDGKFTSTVSHYHLIDTIENAPRVVKKPLELVRGMLNRLYAPRPFVQGMVAYRGSVHACLHRETAAYVLDFVGTPQGKRLLNHLKYAWGPDEVIFQTIILNSPHADRCRYYELDANAPPNAKKQASEAYLHYIEWNPAREDPAVLADSDFERLSTSDFFFARKFDEVKSRNVLDQIDRYLLA